MPAAFCGRLTWVPVRPRVWPAPGLTDGRIACATFWAAKEENAPIRFLGGYSPGARISPDRPPLRREN